MENRVYEHCRKLFREARALPSNEWPSFVKERCQGDAELERRLAGLLDALRDPDPLSPLNLDSGEQAPPKRIGNWELIGEIAKGGAGVVYRARRVGAPEGGVVALKVVRSDKLTADAVSRFANERQILSNLRHQNIARILDAGETAAHLPFYVMEYVDGVSITEYCRRLKLTVKQRAKLFQQVCVAVHFLHDYGILHRDITPNNLLVLRDGFVKIVDFGISKAFDRTTQTREFGSGVNRMMTPAYASPEQLAQQKLNKRSDIYSMGVVLYELLTGALPDDPEGSKEKKHAAPQTVQKYVKASDRVLLPDACLIGFPETAEQLRRVLRGSLDQILMMALQRNPQKRYASAEAFRIDLGRYFQGLTPFAKLPKLAFLRR
jgi:serine/threonine protein kinase